MALLDTVIPKAQAADGIVVLPEGQDPRVMAAAASLAEQHIAKVIVLATPEEQKESMAQAGVSFDGLEVEVVDYLTDERKELLATEFQKVRAHKGVDMDAARAVMTKRLFFGNMLVRQGVADGLVAGSIASTGDMLRAAFQCIGTAPGIKIASSCFMMDFNAPTTTGESTLCFADCAVNPNPTAEQLVDIAISTAKTYRSLTDQQPRVAFLSFSSKGSAKHELVDKVATAVELMQARIQAEGLDVIADGEFQADTALVASVTAQKAPNSAMKGDANILIFPDLQAGNISYKLVERLSGCKAFGPVLQGVAKPVNDLSRGCCVDDIVGVGAITICQSLG